MAQAAHGPMANESRWGSYAKTAKFFGARVPSMLEIQKWERSVAPGSSFLNGPSALPPDMGGWDKLPPWLEDVKEDVKLSKEYGNTLKSMNPNLGFGANFNDVKAFLKNKGINDPRLKETPFEYQGPDGLPNENQSVPLEERLAIRDAVRAGDIKYTPNGYQTGQVEYKAKPGAAIGYKPGTDGGIVLRYADGTTRPYSGGTAGTSQPSAGQGVQQQAQTTPQTPPVAPTTSPASQGLGLRDAIQQTTPSITTPLTGITPPPPSSQPGTPTPTGTGVGGVSPIVAAGGASPTPGAGGQPNNIRNTTRSMMSSQTPSPTQTSSPTQSGSMLTANAGLGSGAGADDSGSNLMTFSNMRKDKLKSRYQLQSSGAGWGAGNSSY